MLHSLNLLALIPERKEFRLHRETTNPVHIIGFLSQWKIYLEEVSLHSGGTFGGKKLDPTVFEKVPFARRD